MASWFGKKAKEVFSSNSSSSHSTHASKDTSNSQRLTPISSRSATPLPPPSQSSTTSPAKKADRPGSTRTVTPNPPTNEAGERTGLLHINVIEGRNFALPPDVDIPPAVEDAVKAAHKKLKNALQNGGDAAAAVAGDVKTKKCWWIPYVVLEYDKNAIVIDSIGGQLGKPTWQSESDFDVSRSSEIVVSAYLRTLPPSTDKTGESRSDVGDDILIARAEISPSLDPKAKQDSWHAATLGQGEFHLDVTFTPAEHERLRMESFDLLALIGKGSFGKVMQVRKKDTGRIYALKTIRKASIASRPGEITHILAERTVLALVDSSFIVGLKFSFQTPEKLYLIMPFINGGELFYHLQKEGRFESSRARFYTAELLCALEHLHSFNVVYRDLKPENILLDYTGHIALCDFGLCKLNMGEGAKTNTFCGTPEYIAPELLENKGYTKTVDWWTLGVLLYEMLIGLPPFYNSDVSKMYSRILHDTLRFPDDLHLSSDARALMIALLKKSPLERLGVNGADEIKKHHFFSKIDWKKLMAKKIQPPFKPSVSGLIDVSNFDPEFTSEKAQDSLVADSNLSETVQDRFKGFTYNPSTDLDGSASVRASAMGASVRG